MVKFLMPIVAMVAVLLIAMTATAMVEQNDSMQWIGGSGGEAREILGTDTQAVAQVVHDPPSCSGNGILDDGLNNDKFTCNRRPVRNILRQGVRLLNFLTC